MSLSDLASIGTLISGVAVLASLIYLSMQIRQNTRHSQALIQQGRAARIADTALRIAELRADAGLNDCFEGAPDASAKDISRFLNVARAVFISAEDSFLQGEEGLLSRSAFESYAASLRAGMGSPGLAAAWLMTREGYEPRFRLFIDAMGGGFGASADRRSTAAWQASLSSLAQTREV